MILLRRPRVVVRCTANRAANDYCSTYDATLEEVCKPVDHRQPDNSSSTSDPSLLSSHDDALIKLHENSGFLDAMLGNVDFYVYAFNTDKQFVYANVPLQNTWGVEPGAYLGKTMGDLRYAPDVAERIEKQIDEVIATRRPISGEIDAYRDGERDGIFAYTISPMFDNDGQVQFVAGISVDVTEQRRNEEQLQRNHDTFHHMIQNNPFGVYLIDSDFRFTTVSLGAKKVFSNIKPLIGRDFEEVIRIIWPEPFATEAIGIFRHTLETGEPYVSNTTTETRADTQEVEAYDWRIERIVMPDGRYGIVAYFYDLSDHHKLDMQLSESEQRFRIAFHTSPSVSVISRLSDGKLIEVNEQFEKILGYSRDEVIGKTSVDLNLWVDIEHRSRLVAQMREKGEIRDVEVDLRTKQGGIRTVVMSAVKVNFRGEETALSSWLDITLRKRTEEALRSSEARYRAIVDGHAEMICRFRPDGSVIFANAPYADAMGTTPEALMYGSFWPFIPEEEHAAVRQMLATLSPEMPSVQIENRIDTIHGVRWTLWTNRAITFDDDGNAIEVQSAGTDITERKEAENVLRQAQAELETRVAARTSELEQQRNRLQALARELSSTEQRERRRLAAILHDDLQQYLVALKMRLTAAGKTSKDADAETVFNDCSELCDQAIASSRNLTRELRPPVLFEDGLVPALRWLVGEKKRRLGLDVTLEATDSQPYLDDEDRSMIFESVRELLLNVAKHSGQKKAVVRVAHHGRLLRVSIRDQGKGFDCSQANLPGQRGSLGLFSIIERIEPIGGRVKVMSAPGEGTEVTIELPIASEVKPEQVNATETVASRDVSFSDKPAAIWPSIKAEARAVVVDDHPIVRQGLVNLLQADPRIQVVGEAGDGVQAVEAVERHKPDVVLMDINLPGRNGIEATREIHRRWPHIHVIGLSVQDDNATRQSMIEAGAKAFISKSDQSQNLVETILHLTSGNN